MDGLNKTLDFLKNAETYFLATVDEKGKARVRPFGTVNIFDGKLYFQTGAIKNVSKQIKNNPYIEICAFLDGKWLRVSGKAVLDKRIEAEKSMLDNYPSLQGMYKAGDGNTEVYYIDEIESMIYSFTEGNIKLI